MNLLNKGQYLGQTFGHYENKNLLIKGSLHNQLESDYHKHSSSYLSILLKGKYIVFISTPSPHSYILANSLSVVESY